MTNVGKVLKSAGLLPAIGGILVNFIGDKSADPLQGYGGVQVHFWALGFCALGWVAATRVYSAWPNLAKRVRPIDALATVGLFILTAFLVLVKLPEDYTSLGEIRWALALIIYLGFYLALGITFV